MMAITVSSSISVKARARTGLKVAVAITCSVLERKSKRALALELVGLRRLDGAVQHQDRNDGRAVGRDMIRTPGNDGAVLVGVRVLELVLRVAAHRRVRRVARWAGRVAGPVHTVVQLERRRDHLAAGGADLRADVIAVIGVEVR